MVSPTLLKSSLRFMLRHRWQTSLSFLAIALGVAIVVAVDLANQSASKAFQLSLNHITGSITHRIVSNSRSIDEQLFVRLRRELGIASSAPKIQAKIKIQQESFTLLGIDVISERAIRRQALPLDKTTLPKLLQTTNGVILPRHTATRLGLEIGESFTADYQQKSLTLNLISAIEPGTKISYDSMIVTDIAIAQHLLQRRGELDQIDLNLSDQQAREIVDWLPPQYRLIDAQARNMGLLAMTKAFHTNLTAMSLLALLVGALLIYNTMNFSALQRQTVIGTYRALGVTRRELMTLLLSEALILALLASTAGILLGYLLSQYLVQLVTRTIDDLYFSLTVSQFILSPWSLLKGLLLGLLTSGIATLLPAFQASRTPPITLQRRSNTEALWQQRYRTLSRVGALTLAAGYCSSLLPSHSLAGGFFSIAMIALGFCLLVPTCLSQCSQLLARGLAPRLSIQGRMAIRDITAGISRTGVAVAALSVAMATVLGVSIMISSFRHSVEQWLDQYLSGDLYISIGDTRQNTSDIIPGTLITQLGNLEGVHQVAELSNFRCETDFGRLRTISLSPTPSPNVPLIDQQSDSHQRYAQGQGVMISEPLAYHQQLSVDDKIKLYTEKGPESFIILGVFRDYSSSRGVISLPPSIQKEYWPSIKPRALVVYLNPNSDQDLQIQKIRSLLKAYAGHYQIVSNTEIRNTSLAIFDQTFAITHVLRLLVLIVAFTGLISALLALQLEKARQHAVLRATGMSLGQLGRSIILQSSMLGMFAALFAMPLGWLLSDRLIHVINRRAFGWSMEQQIPLEVIPQTLFLALVAALLACLYPIINLRRQAIATSLREE